MLGIVFQTGENAKIKKYIFATAAESLQKILGGSKFYSNFTIISGDEHVLK